MGKEKTEEEGPEERLGGVGNRAERDKDMINTLN